ncbi:hypothetical protein [Nocardioides yefusunii]|uniref:ATP synthase protein I n=1 Tax=Nocardioides yefusunii TaxID=2500546 RepID=A0ABW1QW58_9ACTN|nr:hypothetical protein [Nocardioides yefusunii]
MTDESSWLARAAGTVILRRSSLVLVAVVAVLVGVAALVADSRAAGTVLLVGVSTAFVLVFGSWSVHVVAAAMPSASLLVALLTYALQIAAMTALMASLAGSAEWENDIRPGWCVASVVVLVLTWMLLQVWFTTRARVLAYDLPSREGEPRP